MAKLENRVALIYGGTSGLGEATARLYAKEGAKVAIAGRSEERENKIVKDIQDNGGEAVFVKVDLMDSDQIKQSVQDTVDTFGTIDILYNGARILDKYEDIINTDEETFDSVIEINLKAVFTATKEVMPIFVEKGKGVVINLGSQGSKFAGVGGTSYVSSKHALVGFTKQLAYDFGPKGIKANLLAPGYIDTPMTDDVEEKRLKEIPDQRAGKPEEVANLALFLASDDSNYMNGTEVYMDGGWTVGR
ncbi:MAG TPA: SDR family oxidoreductase [Atopostipes sp.]|nr:SDR family oxidoreductase [Atopostipes sp.]